MLTLATVKAQDISLFQQFNGRFDYTAFGNTLNPGENNLDFSFCNILESSSANFNLDSNYQIIKAYLYWAGSGPGDTSVLLNNIPVTSATVYTVNYNDPISGNLSYFSCYADVTDLLINEGNGEYTFSGMDISQALATNSGYCSRRTNFGGWSIYVIYQNSALPLNQINLYQGLEIINSNVQEKEITLNNINVIDNIGAKIGFLAWEGDNNLNYGESLSINNNIISNPPLNLADNAFNGTNSFTNSNTFYNGDLDVYNLENNISIGDTSVSIKLTTGGINENGGFSADLIILNNIITVLNSQLPDATIRIDDNTVNCGDNTINLNYTVFNNNSTAELPANTIISFYTNNQLIGQTSTQNSIAIDNFETGSINLNIPQSNIANINITAVVDDIGNSTGIIAELNEDNNTFTSAISLLIVAPPIELPLLNECNEGFNTSRFNLFNALETITYNPEETSFYHNLDDLQTNSNTILTPEYYYNSSTPETIYAKITNPPCYDIYQFELSIENCPPVIPDGFSPNNDGYNDWFNIQGLYNIFTNHELKIFNRWGVHLFEGNNETPWNGTINRGINNHGDLVPVGTYYYILNLNDANYTPIIGWVYVNY